MTGHETTGRWADDVVATAREVGRLPEYGSAEWHALIPGDPRRFAALVVAAEAWRRFWEQDAVAERLRDELAVAAQLEAAAFADVAAGVRSHADSPSWSEIRGRWAS